MPAPPQLGLWRGAGTNYAGVERYTSSEAAASRVDWRRRTKRAICNLKNLKFTYSYATFASASLAPGRRRSKNHPTPPHARHTKTRTPNEGSTPRHAAVCSAMVSGIE